MASDYFDNFGSVPRKEIDIRKIETLLRIGLKGGLHYLFDDKNKMRISGFYTDGIAWHRPLDKARTIQRLYDQKKDFIDFDSNLNIEPIFSNHKDEKCPDYDKAQLLQACGCMLGAFIKCIFGGAPDSFKTKLAMPIRLLLEKQSQRKRNFHRSGHYKSFAVTQAFLENGRWEYKALEVSKGEQESQMKQFSFQNDMKGVGNASGG